MIYKIFKESKKNYKYVILFATVFLSFSVLGFVSISIYPSIFKSTKNFFTGTKIPESVEKIVQVNIEDGLSTSEIADKLVAEGIIDSSLRFKILSRIHGYDGKLHQGHYTFKTGMSDEEIFAKLLVGERRFVEFTIPEGFSVKDIAKRLRTLELADEKKFLKAAESFAPYEYMEKHPNVFFSAEGFLFPDTYLVENGVTITELLELMADNFDKRLTAEMRNQAQSMGISIYDLITLASLVEREAKFSEDRPIVAQVLLKRLTLGMPLQVDASLQYLLDEPKEDVLIADTEIESPYNTYQNFGLPPGAIANPGLAAIEAVLNPSQTDYLYFVADRDGHNHYASTYDEHLNLVNEYR